PFFLLLLRYWSMKLSKDLTTYPRLCLLITTISALFYRKNSHRIFYLFTKIYWNNFKIWTPPSAAWSWIHCKCCVSKLTIASVIFYNRSGTVFTDLLKDYRALRQFRSGEHTSELQSRFDLVCRLLLEKKKKKRKMNRSDTEVVKQTILPQHQVTPLDQ